MFTKFKTKQDKAPKQKNTIPTIITADVHMIGNIVSDGAVDFSGTIDGNIRCGSLTLRESGVVNGEIEADTVIIQGTVSGLIRAKNVNLVATCKVEGIIIHEHLAIEDGATVDGKFKRSTRKDGDAETTTDADKSSAASSHSGNKEMKIADVMGFHKFDSGPMLARDNTVAAPKMLENIRLIR